MKILLLADSNSIHTSGQLACIRDSEVELGLFSFHGETEQAIRLSAKNGGLQLFLGAGLAGNTTISKVPSHLAMCLSFLNVPFSIVLFLREYLLVQKRSSPHPRS